MIELTIKLDTTEQLAEIATLLGRVETMSTDEIEGPLRIVIWQLLDITDYLLKGTDIDEVGANGSTYRATLENYLNEIKAKYK